MPSFSLIHLKPHESAVLYFHSSVANFFIVRCRSEKPFRLFARNRLRNFLRFTFVSVIAFGSFFSRLVSVCGSSNSWTEFFSHSQKRFSTMNYVLLGLSLMANVEQARSENGTRNERRKRNDKSFLLS